VLGQSRSGSKVTKTVDTLELLVSVGRRFEVLDERILVLDTLADKILEGCCHNMNSHLPASLMRTSVFTEEINVELLCAKASTIGVQWIFTIPFVLVLDSH
jgi:hypothetical protein